MPSLQATHAPASLGAFQDAVFRALFDATGDRAEDLPEFASEPAFAVYRNTAMKGCIDALQASFPAVAHLTGEEWFRVAASIYVRLCPPRTPVLQDYGRSFPDFLAALEPARAWPCLGEVARLDLLWTEAHVAEDAAALDPGAVAGLAIDTLARTILRPHPASRWAWFDSRPVHTIWSQSRAGDSSKESPVARAEGTLIVRPRDVVEWHAIGAAGIAFLEACAFGSTVAVAADAALAADAHADLRALMALLLGAGAFSRMELA